MAIAWTILTLTVPGREAKLAALCAEVAAQVSALQSDVQITHTVHRGAKTYGEEMQAALRQAIAAGAEYVSWVDDDDMILPGYVKHIAGAIAAARPDVVTFNLTRADGTNCALYANATDDLRTVGVANHLCAWKTKIAARGPWLPRNFGADVIWYRALAAAKLVKTDTHIPLTLYAYRFNQSDTRCQDEKSIQDSLSDGRIIGIFQKHDGSLIAKPHVPVVANTRQLRTSFGRLIHTIHF